MITLSWWLESKFRTQDRQALVSKVQYRCVHYSGAQKLSERDYIVLWVCTRKIELEIAEGIAV